MRKLRNKLLLSILTVALTFIALGTTTFAWFTLGGSATANAFAGTVTTPDGIEFSFDGKEWSNQLDLQDVVNPNLRFIDITSSNGTTFVTKADNGEVVEGQSYFTTTIYVRTTNTATTIKLSKVTFTEEADKISWTPDVDLTYTGTPDDATDPAKTWTKGEDAVTFSAINAVRVSFTDGTNTNVIGIEGAYTNGGAKVNGLAAAYAQEKGYTIDSGLANVTPAILTATISDSNEIAAGSQVTVIAANQFSADAPEVDGFINADGYQYATLTINVWLEGWDADCINAILNGQINLGFTFKATFTGETVE